MKFKAIVLRELNKPVVEELTINSKLEDNQTLVKIEYSGLCGAQLQELNGEKGNAKFMPHCMGHEGYGTVVDTKDSSFKEGDKVVMHWRKNYPDKDSFYKYWSASGKEVGAGPITTLAEYAVVNNNRLTKVTNIKPKVGALLGCALTTAYGITNKENTWLEGTNTLIAGAGGLGLAILRMIPPKNKDIFVLEKNTSDLKKSLVEHLGGHIVGSEELETDHKYHYIVDTTGNKFVLENLINMLSPGGKLIMVAKPSYDITLYRDFLFRGDSGITISTTQGGSCIPAIYIPEIISKYDDLDNIITHTMKLDEIDIAVQLMRSGSAGRIVFEL